MSTKLLIPDTTMTNNNNNNNTDESKFLDITSKSKINHDSTDSGHEEDTLSVSGSTPIKVTAKQPLLSLPSPSAELLNYESDPVSCSPETNDSMTMSTSDCCDSDLVVINVEAEDAAFGHDEDTHEDNGQEHPLNSKWCMYFRANKDKEYNATETQKLAEITTIEQFWQVLNHMTLPSNIQKRISPNLMFFRNDIKPEWEDPTNENGGVWGFSITGRNLREKINELWIETLISLIGEQIVHSEYITGVYLQKRQREDRFQLWTRNAPEEIKIDIGRHFKQILISLMNDLENMSENLPTSKPESPELDITSNPLMQNTRFDRVQTNSRSGHMLKKNQTLNEIKFEYVDHESMKNIANAHRSTVTNNWSTHRNGGQNSGNHVGRNGNQRNSMQRQRSNQNRYSSANTASGTSHSNGSGVNSNKFSSLDVDRSGNSSRNNSMSRSSSPNIKSKNGSVDQKYNSSSSRRPSQSGHSSHRFMMDKVPDRLVI